TMTKVISLSETAYAEMKSVKQTDESFSDVVHRLVGRQRPLSDFFGKWPGSAEELERIKTTLAAERKRFKTKEVEF
ncbi:antitoxin VapB family protein, partial [Candidatus Woesearchaeota archaeon]|nr:antitoxin VapB family protein [Candidatus Woesearchaeota archaeon]